MNKNPALRIISYFVLLASIVSMPWWFSLLLAVSFLFYFNHYYEAVFFAFVSDVLYSAETAKFSGYVLVSFGVVLVLALLIEFLKKRMVFDF